MSRLANPAAEGEEQKASSPTRVAVVTCCSTGNRSRASQSVSLVRWRRCVFITGRRPAELDKPVTRRIGGNATTRSGRSGRPSPISRPIFLRRVQAQAGRIHVLAAMPVLRFGALGENTGVALRQDGSHERPRSALQHRAESTLPLLSEGRLDPQTGSMVGSIKGFRTTAHSTTHQRPPFARSQRTWIVDLQREGHTGQCN